MIDYEARKLAANLLEDVIAGNMSNWQLEDKWPISENDPAINCIMRWVWTLYDDDQETMFVKNLSQENLQILSRCLAFLRSDSEFLVKKPTKEESIAIKKKWGVEWRTDCTCPEDSNNWPYPETSTDSSLIEK